MTARKLRREEAAANASAEAAALALNQLKKQEEQERADILRKDASRAAQEKLQEDEKDEEVCARSATPFHTTVMHLTCKTWLVIIFVPVSTGILLVASTR